MELHFKTLFTHTWRHACNNQNLNQIMICKWTVPFTVERFSPVNILLDILDQNVFKKEAFFILEMIHCTQWKHLFNFIFIFLQVIYWVFSSPAQQDICAFEACNTQADLAQPTSAILSGQHGPITWYLLCFPAVFCN